MCISSFLLLSRILYYEYSPIFLSLFPTILSSPCALASLRVIDGCCGSRHHMQTAPFKGQEKLFLLWPLRNLSRSFPKNILSCFIGQNHILHARCSTTHWQRAWDSHSCLRLIEIQPWGWGRVHSPEEHGSLVPEQNQGSFSKKGGQWLLVNNLEWLLLPY